MFSREQLQKPSSVPKQAVEPKATRKDSTEPPASGPQFSYSLAGIRIFARGENQQPFEVRPAPQPLPFPLQANLMVGASHDPLEQEADHVAEQVMGMPESGTTSASLDQKKEHDDHARVQMKAAGSGIAQGMEAPPIVHEVLRSPGQPLDATTRAFMEPKFGHDFSKVRVHTGDKAAESAGAVGARAFTVGNNVVFGNKEYMPDSESGKKLLSHELTHTLQASNDSVTLRRQRKTPLTWDLRLRNELNRFEIVFSDFAFEYDVLTTIFKSGQVPRGFSIDASGGGSISTKWILTVPSSPWTDKADTFFEAGFAKQLVQLQGQRDKKATDAANSDAIRTARAAFRERHKDHKPEVLENIDRALMRVTKDNPELLLAYYTYYADHKLTDEIDNKRRTGATSHGNTDINEVVLATDAASLERAKFPTGDPLSLLGGTLLHEYSHTPQDLSFAGVDEEAKAYGIEYFFAERMGDEKRTAFISNRYNGTDQFSPPDKLWRSYNIIRALYNEIERKGVSGKAAREMAVEYISKNTEDFSPDLKEFISHVSQKGSPS